MRLGLFEAGQPFDADAVARGALLTSSVPGASTRAALRPKILLEAPASIPGSQIAPAIRTQSGKCEMPVSGPGERNIGWNP